MNQLGITVEVMPADVPEDFDESASPADNARRLAGVKARAVAETVDSGIVLGADTIVAIDGAMLAKPVDRQDAIRMLELLSGREHRVFTGYSLVRRPDGASRDGVEETIVTFRRLSRKEIEQYVDGGSPMDKAGAYGIQDDYGAVFIPRIEGCFYNVVGLPLSAVHGALTSLGAFGDIETEGRYL
jgi:septum formation protein